MKKYISLVIFAVILIIWLFISPKIAQIDEETVKGINTQLEEKEATTTSTEPYRVSVISESETIQDLITQLAKENDFDVDTALRIAECESQFGKYKHNWQGSSAYGLYQFMPRTFNTYCKGNIESDKDQIICFMELYPSKPHWWKCK